MDTASDMVCKDTECVNATTQRPISKGFLEAEVRINLPKQRLE